jgi:hypothetical protein
LHGVTIALSFSACGTVRGKLSCIKLAQPRERKVVRLWGGVRYAVLASLVVLELVPSHAYHDIVEVKPTGIYNPFCLNAERSLLSRPAHAICRLP